VKLFRQRRTHLGREERGKRCALMAVDWVGGGWMHVHSNGCNKELGCETDDVTAVAQRLSARDQALPG